MKQTAVDYLWNDLIANPGNYIKAYQKAKEMEKEQHIDTFEEGYNAGWCMAKEYADEPQIYDAEEYYNETYE